VIDLAAPVLGSFQVSLDSAFGNDLGWAIGHIVLVSALAASIYAVRERNHIIAHSGVDKQLAFDAAATLLLTLVIYWVFTAVFGFASGASVGLSFVTAISTRWMITIMG